MPHVEPIHLPLTPEQVMARWPRAMPLAALLSCESSRASQGRSRWSIVARPEYTREFQPGEDPLVVLGMEQWTGRPARTSVPGGTPGPLILPHVMGPPAVPFTGGWIGYLSYDFGKQLEPSATAGGADRADHQMPMAAWAWCPEAYVHDNLAQRWWRVGDGTLLPSVEQLCEAINQCNGRPARSNSGCIRPGQTPGPLPYAIEDLQSDMGQIAYQQAVVRCVEYIHAGDVFQANIAHVLAGRFRGDARAFFLGLARAARPWYGAYLETERGVIASASPEMFLHYDAGTRRIVTRPMKGTRDASDANSKSELATSRKDQAELTMIVDLMRNDLGRVCDYGSVRVEEARVIERHGEREHVETQVHSEQSATPAQPLSHPTSPGVLQGVGTVSGTLRERLGVADLLRAAFPPGSVTGAPKVRAMQIIDVLEGTPRGPYCGAIGYVSRSGDAQFSVAIRTAIIEHDQPGTTTPDAETTGRLSYSVGAGIVSDSVPDEEWAETLVKAGVLTRTLGVSSELG